MNKLKQADNFRLMTAVKEDYEESRLSDSDFAVKMVEELGCNVTDNNVAGAREALGIPSNTARVRTDPAAGVKVLEALARIEDKLDRLLKWGSEQARRDL